MNKRNIPIELIIWVSGLLWLAFSHPEDTHFTVCPLALVGFEHCPGCGLGHSISYLLRGEWQLSWQSHPLGTFALVIILNVFLNWGKRILLKRLLKQNRRLLSI
jgi:hypothetical protein